MKKWNRKIVLAIAVFLTGCGSRITGEGIVEDSSGKSQVTVLSKEDQEEGKEAGNNMEDTGQDGDAADFSTEAVDGTGIKGETARDAEVDFEALKQDNPEIFAWLYIPDTDIDAPVLQSMESDDYYETHNAWKDEDEKGALYIEAANLDSMCDFNTVVHGKASKDKAGGLFDDLYRFADPDFFDSHEQLYIYLEDNVLTYEVFAAYGRENTSLIRDYDFTYFSGCEQFLNDLYGIREMDMMIRTGWDDVTPFHFLVTLTAVREDKPEEQFVVIAALIEDPAGKIDRLVIE